MTHLIYYLIGINIITFFVYGFDKLKAKAHAWRIPEATLILLAVIGGSLGALLGMYVFRHKTQHIKFKYGVPAILIIQLALFFLTSCSTKKTLAADSEIVKRERKLIGTPEEYNPHTLIIYYDKENYRDELLKAVKKYKAEIIYDYRTFNAIAIRLPEKKTVDEAIPYFQKVKGVLSVNRDRVYHLHQTQPAVR